MHERDIGIAALSNGACPVPTAEVLILYPVFFSKSGTRTSSRPES